MTPLPVRRESGAVIHAEGSAAWGRADTSTEGAGASAPGTLLPHLPTGRRHATSVPILSSLSGLSEREVRAEIERLVTEERIPVCTLPTAAGIWVAETPEELELADAHIRSKAMSLLRRRRALRLCRERIAWSPTLF